CHDVSDGGLLVALAEMAIAGKIGVTVDSLPDEVPAHGVWFGEDQARYALTVRPEDMDRRAARAAGAGVMLTRLGTTGGSALTLPG
ncbi:AIR synthase-related protein, partial [Proteus mirabilis]|uniref:AIR synthase-related protein n=1 Tax=Proteus mirabilis TaxID=584 RepID=UPI00195459B2